VSASVLGLRGATTVDVDEQTHIVDRVQHLLEAMLERNDIHHDDLISIIFTATDDIHSCFPALGAREMGLGDVPLLCARELDVIDGTPQCIRVLIHFNSLKSRAEVRHVYLEGASNLRDDLPQ